MELRACLYARMLWPRKASSEPGAWWFLIAAGSVLERRVSITILAPQDGWRGGYVRGVWVGVVVSACLSVCLFICFLVCLL